MILVKGVNSKDKILPCMSNSREKVKNEFIQWYNSL